MGNFQSWLRENVIAGILIAVIMVMVTMLFNTQKGFAQLDSTTKATLAKQDEKIRGYVALTNEQVKEIKLDQTKITNAINRLRTNLDSKFEFLIKFNKQHVAVASKPPNKLTNKDNDFYRFGE